MFAGLAKFVQFLLDAIVAVLNVVCSLFPPSPFNLVLTGIPANVFASINYFVPLAEIVVVMEMWLLAVVGYYIISVVARWLKAIE